MDGAVGLLNNMVQMWRLPVFYECVAEYRGQHSDMFKYQCRVNTITVKAAHRNKQKARTEAARVMLWELASRGAPLPPPYGTASVPDNKEESKFYNVYFLKLMCRYLGFPQPSFELVLEEGSINNRMYTMKAELDIHLCFGRAASKKRAKHLAAVKMIRYLLDLAKDLDQDPQFPAIANSPPLLDQNREQELSNMMMYLNHDNEPKYQVGQPVGRPICANQCVRHCTDKSTSYRPVARVQPFQH